MILGVWISCRPVAEIIIFYKPNQYIQSQCALAIKMQYEILWTDYRIYLVRRTKKKSSLKEQASITEKTEASIYKSEDYGCAIWLWHKILI